MWHVRQNTPYCKKRLVVAMCVCVLVIVNASAQLLCQSSMTAKRTGYGVRASDKCWSAVSSCLLVEANSCGALAVVCGRNIMYRRKRRANVASVGRISRNNTRSCI